MKRKKEAPPKPPGCRTCNSKPWVAEENGMRRCDCPLGVWFLQRERERSRTAVGLFAMDLGRVR